jgi:hypothetical protein
MSRRHAPDPKPVPRNAPATSQLALLKASISAARQCSFVADPATSPRLLLGSLAEAEQQSAQARSRRSTLSRIREGESVDGSSFESTLLRLPATTSDGLRRVLG